MGMKAITKNITLYMMSVPYKDKQERDAYADDLLVYIFPISAM